MTVLPRSMLFSPATSGRKLEKAFAGTADGISVHLEDAVAIAKTAQAPVVLKARRTLERSR